MLLLKWKSWPWDAQMAHAAVGSYALSTALTVVFGPELLLMLTGCLVTTTLAVISKRLLFDLRR